MLLKKSTLFVYIIFLSGFCSFAQTKVACIGNSITYGYGIDNRETNNYPALLSKQLGDGWEVKNFGVNGATMLKKGNKPYWQQQEFSDAKSFNPDIVIIKLGTNDTKPMNWKFKSDFIDNYTNLINEFRNLPSKPTIYICLPVPAYGERWGIRDSIINTDIIPMIKTIASANHTILIDLNTPLLNHIELFPDLIHPNADGAKIIANTIFTAISNNKKNCLLKE